MKYVYASLPALAVGGLAYLMSNNLFAFLGVSLVFAASFIFLLIPWLESKTTLRRKGRECFLFVSSFVTSMSLTSSLERSYENALESSGRDGELQRLAASLPEEGVKERLHYLERYFELERYRMFLSLFSLYEQQGGDILSIAKSLLDELTRVEEMERSIEKESARSLREYLVMWILSGAMLFGIRFGLMNYWEVLEHNLLFMGSVVLYFAVLLGSILVYFYAYCGKPKTTLFRRKKHEETE